MAITIERGTTRIAAPKRRVGRPLSVLSVLAVAAVLIAGLTVLTTSNDAPTAAGPVAQPIYTQDELTVLDLVGRGVLPVSILATEPYRTKRLVAEGIIPRATLKGGASAVVGLSVEPLYCPEELAVLQAVRAGTMSSKILNREPFRTKRLIAQGLIPRAAASPC